MRLRTLAAGVATLALALTACGDSDTDLGSGGGSSDAAYEVVSSPSFDSGSTMAKLNSAGKIKIGVKYDQPGIGNKNPATGKPEGLDIEIGKIVAGQLGLSEDKVEWVELRVRSCRAEGCQYELGCQFPQTPNWNLLLQFG